jgi:ATP/maltotriose-dependent transcriptional regulator MalT
VQFSHPLVRTAIAQRESVSRRQAAHRALGAVITVNSHRRAWHRGLGTAALDDGIAAELETVAADSVRHGDTASAIRALERAAQLSAAPADRGRRLLLAAGHAARLGRPDVVVRLLGLAEGSDLSAFDRVRAELLREDFEGFVIADSSRVLRLCGAAREAAAAGETDLAVELADAAVRRRCAAPVDPPALLQMTSLARTLAGQYTSARTVAVLALADPVGHGRTVLSMLADVDQDVLDGDGLGDYGVAARAVGSYSVASDLLDRAEGDLRLRGLLGPLARTLCVAADVRLDLGDWDRAQAALTEFATLAAASMSTSHRATALATTAKLAALRGDPAGALAMVSETEHSPGARSGSRYLARAQIVRGIAGLATGRHGDAFDALSRVFQPDDPSHHYREQFDAVAYLAEAAAHTGRQDEAADLVQRMQIIADTSGSPMLTAQLAYATAVLASDDATEQLFLAALASGAAASPWQRARLQLAYGRWLRRQQRVTHSRGPLRSALATLQALGAERWAAEARDELTATGEPADAAPPSPLLSAQESKIAHLAARGLSNREIGQQLYLSPRTVSSHLYRIFPKLDISTRGQIAARLAGEPATSSVVRRSAAAGPPDAVDRPKPGGPPRS